MFSIRHPVRLTFTLYSNKTVEVVLNYAKYYPEKRCKMELFYTLYDKLCKQEVIALESYLNVYVKFCYIAWIRCIMAIQSNEKD